MRLKELNLLSSDVKDKGLKEFSSNKFNDVIALVGKNGSGKSRYLNIIENKLRNLDFSTNFETYFHFPPKELQQHYNKYLQKKQLYDSFFEYNHLQKEVSNSPNNAELSKKYSEAAQKFSNLSRVDKLNPTIISQSNKSISSEINKRLKIIKPSDLRLLQASFDNKNGKIKFQDIIDSTSEAVDVNEFEMISESALTFLKRLPHKLAYDDIDCRGDEKKFKNRISYKRFELLKDLIKDFLDKDLEWKSRTSDVNEYDDHVNIKSTGYWTINDREFNYNDFSDGEKVLFTYAILLFLLSTNPRIKFKESIIIIDEPELNLHPKAQIKLIQSLENLIKDEGQLIIATHSLSILANLDYGSIFLVKNNQLLTPSSSVPFNAVDELMGFEEHYNKIVEFLVSTPSWAMTNFMAQCFEDPEVFESANKKDPQLEIFKELTLKGTNLKIGTHI